METGFKYYAFISYKREDEKWAKWLQNKLETYKLPTSLAKETEKEIPKTFHPCFRDKTDLSETGDLSQILHDKLQKSQYLIVVCSPRSAKSKWVNKEVETFQEMGRADKIIPFIIEGNPDTSNPNVHCYPTTLNENILGISIPELGKEKAIVKIFAMMLNVNFDTLWNRHRERILKKRINLSILIAVVMLLFGGIFIWQNIKISEQYARAQKLIDAFYFYDGKFALAYGKIDYFEQFYFIDKNGDAVDKLGYWKKSEQFNQWQYGFAKVTDRDGLEYFIDTLGNKYKYTNDINKLDTSIQALELDINYLSDLFANLEKLKNIKYINLIPTRDTRNLENMTLVAQSLYSLSQYATGKLANFPADIINTSIGIILESIADVDHYGGDENTREDVPFFNAYLDYVCKFLPDAELICNKVSDDGQFGYVEYHFAKNGMDAYPHIIYKTSQGFQYERLEGYYLDVDLHTIEKNGKHYYLLSNTRRGQLSLFVYLFTIENNNIVQLLDDDVYPPFAYLNLYDTTVVFNPQKLEWKIVKEKRDGNWEEIPNSETFHLELGKKVFISSKK